MKVLTDEQRRILRAVAEGRMFRNEHYRWLIAGEARPDRRERERLVKRGFIVYDYQARAIRLTEKGEAEARPSTVESTSPNPGEAPNQEPSA